MLIKQQLILLAFTLLFACRDGINYYLHGKPDGKITRQRCIAIKMWHGTGVVLQAGILFLLLWIDTWQWWLLLFALLIRISFYDMVHNIFAGLDPAFIGNTAYSDKIFRNIFGADGGIVKCISAFAFLILTNFLTGIYYEHI